MKGQNSDPLVILMLADFWQNKLYMVTSILWLKPLVSHNVQCTKHRHATSTYLAQMLDLLPPALEKRNTSTNALIRQMILSCTIASYIFSHFSNLPDNHAYRHELSSILNLGNLSLHIYPWFIQLIKYIHH